MSTSAIVIECLFFCLGMIPWWCACWMREKTLRYWCIFIWVCCIMLVYYAMHGAPVGVINSHGRYDGGTDALRAN